MIGTVPAGRAEHARQAFEIAAGYKSKLTRYERQQILFRTAEALASRREEISDLITLELGISKTDSLYEVGRAYDVFTLSAQMCIQDDGQIFSCDLTPHGKARKIFTTREPLKAISAITPFNHPLNMVSHKVAPAIATNNCVVVKPTELTPMTALLLADILYEAGLPPEMLSVVTGWPADIGNEMITNENIDLITFTGGVPVGKMIAAHRRLQAPGARTRRQRSADHPQRSLATTIWQRRRTWQWPERRKTPASAAPRSSASSSRKASPTASCRWCWSGRRRSASAIRWTARPTSAPSCTRRRRHCSKRACTWPPSKAPTSSTIPAVRARCCRRSSSIACRIHPNW